MKNLLLTVFSYFIGSMMFSFWLGKMIGKDIRDYGDKNPGGANAFKAGGWQIGIPGMLLDLLKGLIPVAITYRYYTGNIWLVPMAVAPVLGHAFSPFLKFKGGKGIATSFGIWTALTLWRVPVVLGSAFLFGKFVLRIKNDAWTVVLGFAIVVIFTALFFNNPKLVIISVLNLIIVTYKHLLDLKRRR
ncbi:MAG: glycerol-3-phosphate acyltransferase [candidate division WOR-3 bacterium]|nr:glycerol-3-phosphate acyltransferase [candidate division WOR-3 bacterium]